MTPAAAPDASVTPGAPPPSDSLTLPVVHLALATSAGEREAAIARAILADLGSPRWPAPPDQPPQSDMRPGHAVLLEGLPDGNGRLEALCEQYQFPLSRIAPGCLCCAGQVIMRVTVNRLLRQRPRHLYIGLATTAHQDQLRTVLQGSPYAGWLVQGDDLA